MGIGSAPGRRTGAPVSIVAVDSWLSGQRQQTTQNSCHENGRQVSPQPAYRRYALLSQQPSTHHPFPQSVSLPIVVNMACRQCIRRRPLTSSGPPYPTVTRRCVVTKLLAVQSDFNQYEG